MRGDRPVQAAGVVLDDLFTPHARGSTAMTWMTDLIGQVYPACAGIDLAQKGCAPM